MIGTVAGTAAPLVVSAAFSFCGSLALALHPALASAGRRTGPPARASGAPLSALVATGLLLVLGCAVAQIAVVGYASAHHAPGQSGFVLAVWSLGSIVGGFCVGARVNASAERGLSVVLGVAGAGLLVVLAAPDLALLYPLMFVAGLAIVPALGSMYNLAAKLAPPSGSVEAFGWIASGTQTGIAGGAALGGVVLQRFGTTVTFAFASACVLGAAVVVRASTTALARAAPTALRTPGLTEAAAAAASPNLLAQDLDERRAVNGKGLADGLLELVG